MKFWNRRRLAGLLIIFTLLVAGVAAGLILYVTSPAFEERARRYIVEEIEKNTGGKAGLGRFDLDLWHQRFILEDLTLRGLEPATASPLAHFDRLDVGLNFRSLIQRRIDLFELSILRPELHVLIAPDGTTNFPMPPATAERRSFNFEISVDNFMIREGMAWLNERRVEIDFGMTNLEGSVGYQTQTGVLSTRIKYDGSLNRDSGLAIPYGLDAQLDYVRGTVLAHQVRINSAESELNLQGKITDLLNRDLAGKLEYSGKIDVPFLNYFFRNENFAGVADMTGFLEFSRGYFFTSGTAASQAIEFEGWRLNGLRTTYTYHYPEKRASFRNLSARLADGDVSGGVVIENLPGTSRVNLDVDYAGVDAAALAKAYPWNPQYRIFSRVSGTLQGWFEGKLTRYLFSGDAKLAAYVPGDTSGVIPLSLEGSTAFSAQPGQITIANAEARFGSTTIKADGLIHDTASNLKLTVSSPQLSDVSFLYKDANGIGSFEGALLGPIRTPRLEGSFSLQDHVFRNHRIERVAGNIRLDTLTEAVDLVDVTVGQGQSTITVSGAAALDGSRVDLRMASARILGSDLAPLLGRNIDGRFSGNVHVTSLKPLVAEGDVRADGLVVENRLVGDMRSHVNYAEPVVELTQLSVRNGEASVTGQGAFNQQTRALKLSARMSSANLEMFRWAGLPESVSGVITQADVRADGTASQPNLQGEVEVRNLSFYGEAFPQVRLTANSAGSVVNLTMETGRSLDLTARIDVARTGYPFTAAASFVRYPLERIAGLSEGTVTVTGNADLGGLLSDRRSLHGEGRIQSAQVTIQQRSLNATVPFTFAVDSDRLTLSNLTFTGGATEVRVGGTIGFTETEALNLDVSGRFDLALLAAATPDWTSNGTLSVEGRVGGTVKTPDLRGVARFANASVGRRGVFTTLSALNGDVFFDQNRITLNNLEGQVGGGSVTVQGTALLRDRRVQEMNVRIESKDVRVRYPEGLRTVVSGSLILSGDQLSPLLEGNLEILSMAYTSDFEEFLALIQDTGNDFGEAETPLESLNLAIHVEGNRNISIRNQIADVEARVDLDIRGTVSNPGITGHVEASGGSLVFQGTRYEVTRGNVDFVDPLRIQPVVDIQAEAALREYRVILAISGRSDRLRLDLRSDPPLPQLEIVSLVAGGPTREELAQTSDRGVPTSEQLFQRGAGSILFDLLQSRVGGRMGLLGLDRVRIDPFLVGAENDPVARITISEKVTKDLAITYSQDLSSNRQQVIIIEYFVTKDTSVLATRDETGAFGLDIKFRRRFK